MTLFLEGELDLAFYKINRKQKTSPQKSNLVLKFTFPV